MRKRLLRRGTTPPFPIHLEGESAEPKPAKTKAAPAKKKAAPAKKPAAAATQPAAPAKKPAAKPKKAAEPGPAPEDAE